MAVIGIVPPLVSTKANELRPVRVDDWCELAKLAFLEKAILPCG